MMGQLEVEERSAASWAAEAGRQAVTALLALAFLGAAMLSVVTTDTGSPAPAQGSPAASEASTLRMALDDVLNVLAVAGPIAGPVARPADGAEGSETTDAVDDAWRTLAVVHERITAQLQVAEGARLPLMGAPPPAPQRVPRDDALLRAALSYVGGALEARDVVALGRARDLLEAAREG